MPPGQGGTGRREGEMSRSGRLEKGESGGQRVPWWSAQRGRRSCLQDSSLLKQNSDAPGRTPHTWYLSQYFATTAPDILTRRGPLVKEFLAADHLSPFFGYDREGPGRHRRSFDSRCGWPARDGPGPPRMTSPIVGGSGGSRRSVSCDRPATSRSRRIRTSTQDGALASAAGEPHSRRDERS
jgi:hypothetical protein